jgi:dihydroneopterin aldolase
LQETLCDDLARALLLNSKVSAVLIRSEKPDVYPDCFSVGTEVFQIKDDF